MTVRAPAAPMPHRQRPASVSAPLLALALVAAPCAATTQREPVPDAPRRAAVGTDVLHRVIDRLLLDQGEFPADVRAAQLLDLAVGADDAAQRFVLFEEALRVARERGTLSLHRTVLDEFATEFEIDRLPRLVQELGDRVEREDARPRGLVLALVEELAERIEERDQAAAAAETAALTWAERSGDARLLAWARREIEGLRAARAAWNSVDKGDAAAVDAFREAHAPLDAPIADADKLDLIGAADRLRGRARDAADPIVKRNLRRRAWRSYASAWTAAEGLERARIENQLTDLENTLAQDLELTRLTFDTADDLAELVFARGQWKVHEGALHGQAGVAGTASTATLQLPFASIDCVRIQGGIESADGLNFRAAVGPCNLLLNWEVAEESHAYLGSTQQVLPHHVLTQGQSHDIRIRQLGDRVALFIDGTLRAAADGSLQGTVSVYPALHSTIFVDELTVLGSPDSRAATVDGPTHECR